MGGPSVILHAVAVLHAPEGHVTCVEFKMAMPQKERALMYVHFYWKAMIFKV